MHFASHCIVSQHLYKHKNSRVKHELSGSPVNKSVPFIPEIVFHASPTRNSKLILMVLIVFPIKSNVSWIQQYQGIAPINMQYLRTDYAAYHCITILPA
jgi:hypothetical protein